MQIACLQTQKLHIWTESKALVHGPDPFSYDFVGDKSDVVPPGSACDLISYLVLQTNFITRKQFNAYKSLVAYNQLVCGWVKAYKRMPIV